MQKTLPMSRVHRTLLCGLAVLFCALSAALYAEANARKPSDFKILPLTQHTAEPLRKKFEDWLDRTHHEEVSTWRSKHPNILAWHNSLSKVDLKTNPLEGLARVNRITNKSVTYVSDYVHHALSDYWETPVETLTEGGDCEDIALLKAVALHHMGWPREDMHLLLGYTRYRGKKIAHAVLLVDHAGERYVLDNMVNALVPFSNAMLQPMYMLNMDSTEMFYPANHPAPPFETSGGH